MKQQVSRTIAKNLVVAATMALAVFASWAITGVRHPSIDIGTMDACSGGTGAAVHRACKAGAQEG